MKIGEQIRELRIQKGLSQSELLKKAGMKSSPALLSTIENGKTESSRNTLIKLTEALGARYVEFISSKHLENLDEEYNKAVEAINIVIDNILSDVDIRKNSGLLSLLLDITGREIKEL